MKQILIIIIGMLSLFCARGQSPDKVSYQAVLRNSAGEPLGHTTVGLRLSVVQNSMPGSAVYAETHIVQTNEVGLLSVELGGGLAETGSFGEIDWSAGPYSIGMETDPGGGTNYTITGVSGLLSVPYALHTRYASDFYYAVSATGDTLYLGEGGWVIIPGISDANGGTNPPPPGVGSYPPGYVHCDPANPTAVVDVTNPITGQTWMDRNLGASRAATSYDDAEAYGDWYQWGRFADGHQCRDSETTSTNATTAEPNGGNAWDGKFILEGSGPYDWLTPKNNNLWQGLNGINNPCPAGYRMPTESELDAERQSWVSNDRAGAFASPLRLPVSGYRYYSSGEPYDVGSFGRYWSSSVSWSNARSLRFYSSYADMYFYLRAFGFAVRCLKD